MTTSHEPQPSQTPQIPQTPQPSQTPATTRPVPGQPPLDQAARDRIRTAHDSTLFVEAGAGTGKTAALVARVVELVATGRLADVTGLAAITFSENAAAELRNRIRAGLETVATEHLRSAEFGSARALNLGVELRG
ncbi:MAG: UvrD-helicase domain-containing protein [Micromonosporaceae bacterium]|nr:UvrD-helicase domain-containing protein [Micromonosporaceae bacterium]